METRIDLTEEEIRSRGHKLAILIREKSQAEEARKDAAKEAADEISEMETQIHQLAREIRERCRYEEAQQELTGLKTALDATKAHLSILRARQEEEGYE